MCLLYADIDGLRSTTRHIFIEQKQHGNRRPEIEIRKEIRRKLAVCLEDAFFDLTGQDAKFDLFELGEPDIIIMVRGTGRECAKAFAQEGKRKFHDETNSNVTIALLCINEVPDESRNASKLDEEAERRLNIAKDQLRGTVWP